MDNRDVLHYCLSESLIFKKLWRAIIFLGNSPSKFISLWGNQRKNNFISLQEIKQNPLILNFSRSNYLYV